MYTMLPHNHKAREQEQVVLIAVQQPTKHMQEQFTIGKRGCIQQCPSGNAVSGLNHIRKASMFPRHPKRLQA